MLSGFELRVGELMSVPGKLCAVRFAEELGGQVWLRASGLGVVWDLGFVLANAESQDFRDQGCRARGHSCTSSAASKQQATAHPKILIHVGSPRALKKPKQQILQP